jgi:hypothetical protein
VDVARASVEGNKRGANIGTESFRHDHTRQRGGVNGEQMRERGLGGSFGDRVILSDEKLKINIECKAQKIIYIPKIATLVTTGI